jgi:hypothetical protein
MDVVWARILNRIPGRSRSPLASYLPEDRWFLRYPHGVTGIHGISHLARVLFWSDVLASSVAEPVMIEELRWAAACHDLGRENDGRDPRHGARSAEWVLRELRAVREATGPLNIDVIAHLCRFHDSADHARQAPPLELAILRDADALDRTRFNGRARTDPDRLRLEHARVVLPAAAKFAAATRGRGSMTGGQILDLGDSAIRPFARRLLAEANGRG